MRHSTAMTPRERKDLADNIRRWRAASAEAAPASAPAPFTVGAEVYLRFPQGTEHKARVTRVNADGTLALSYRMAGDPRRYTTRCTPIDRVRAV